MATPSSPLPAGSPKPLYGIGLVLARAGWVAFLVLVLWLMVYSLPYIAFNLRFDQVVSDSYNLFQQRIGFTVFLRFLAAVQYAISLFFIGVGCLIFFRRSSDRIALLTALTLVGLPYMGYFSGLVYETHPDGLYGRFLYQAEGTATVVSIFAVALLLLVFPDGKYTLKWGARPIKVLLAASLIAVGFAGLIAFTGDAEARVDTPLGPVSIGELSWVIGSAGIILITVLGIFSQIYKYLRASSPPQRQQTKWVFFSLMVGAIWVLINLAEPTN